MKNKTERHIKTIGINLLILLFAGIFIGWVYITFPETIERFGIPFAPQFFFIALIFFLLGLVCYKTNKTTGRGLT